MIPEEIERLMPLEFGDVRLIESDGRYNVYMDVSRWTASSRGRPQRITGICVGYISPQEGFVPNEEGRMYLNSRKPATVKNMGGYELLRQLCPGMEDRVRRAFPSQYREIVSMALIEAVNVLSDHDVYQDQYERSVLSEWYPGLDLTSDGAEHAEEQAGRGRKGILAYMNAWLREAGTKGKDKGTAYLLDVPKHMRDLCADEDKFEDELGDMVTDRDYGSLLVDFVKEQYVFTLDSAIEYLESKGRFYGLSSTILKLADFVCLVITPEGKYMTSVPDKLQDFLDIISDRYPVTLSINPYLI